MLTPEEEEKTECRLTKSGDEHVLSKSDDDGRVVKSTKRKQDVARYVVLRIPPLVHL